MSQSLGTVLKKGSTEIGGLTSIGAVEVTAESIDVTTLEDEYRKYEKGLKDTSEISIEGFLKDGTALQAMQEAFDSDQTESFTIEFPTTPTTPKISWSFSALVIGFSTGDVSVGEPLTFGATLKISDEPTLTIGGVGS